MTFNSGTTAVINQMRVCSVSLKMSDLTTGNSAGYGNGSIKVDNNPTVTRNDNFTANYLNGFILGGAYWSFRGRIYYVKISDKKLTESELVTLHTNLRTAYGF